MKTKMKGSNKAAVRRQRVSDALRVVRALIKQYDSSIVQGALNIIKDEERAARELKNAEAKVAALKNRVKK